MIFSFPSFAMNAAFSLLYASVEAGLLLFFLWPYAEAGRKRFSPPVRLAAAALCVLALWACCMGQTDMNLLLNTLLYYLAVLVGVLAVYRLSLAEGLSVALVFHLTADLSKSFVLDMIPVFSQVKDGADVAGQLAALLLVALVQALALAFLRRIVCRRSAAKPALEHAMLLLFPAASYIYVKCVQNSLFALRDSEMLPVAQLGGMSFFMCLLALCIIVLGEYVLAMRAERQQAMLAQLRLERQQKEMALHRQRIDEINKLSHDMRNHLATISSMSDSDAIRAYIASLEPSLQPVVMLEVTGCEAFDVLLSRKMEACAAAGGTIIPCIAREAVPLLARLNPADLCTICANLLDNAIEAVAGMDAGRAREIVLRANRRGDFLLLRTENPFSGERRETEDGFETTKPDAQAHGYGMRSVRDTIRRLGGEMTVYIREQQFIVNALIPIDARDAN